MTNCWSALKNSNVWKAASGVLSFPRVQVCSLPITERSHLLVSVTFHSLILIKLCIFWRTEYCHAYHLPINVIANGNQIFPQIARPGKRLTFKCSRSGLFLQGAKEVECLPTGQWSQPFPKCEGKPCRFVCVCVRTYVHESRPLVSSLLIKNTLILITNARNEQNHEIAKMHNKRMI